MSFLGEYYNTILVILGAVLLSTVSGLSGVFAFIRKKSLMGDVVAHSVLPGIILAFITFQSRNPLILLLGALLSGGLSISFTNWLSNKAKIKEDAALAFAMTVFFALGVCLMYTLQNTGQLAQAGLNDFLFGKAAAINQEDLIWLSSAAIFIVIILALFYRSILVFSFSESFAQATGLPVKFLNFILTVALVWNISISLQTTGVVMSAALMITPAASARFWTDSLKGMFILSALFGAISGAFGACVSLWISNMPTGPWIVIALTVIAVISFAFSPKGRIVNLVKNYRMNARLAVENLIKNLYKITENADDKSVSVETLKNFYNPGPKEWKRGLNTARISHYIWLENGRISLSEKGKHYAGQIVRAHRLWELYIATFAKVPDEWIHADAEHFEHFIGHLEQKELLKVLNNPMEDPHNKPIPPYE